MNKTLDNYEKNRKIKRVSFHLGSSLLFFSIAALIAKSYLLTIILFVLFLIDLAFYISSNKKYKLLVENFKIKCPICDEDIKYEEKCKYLISNVEVEKSEFDISLNENKTYLKIKKYFCLKDKFCYVDIETYVLNRKQEFVLIKKQNSLDLDYDNTY